MKCIKIIKTNNIFIECVSKLTNPLKEINGKLYKYFKLKQENKKIKNLFKQIEKTQQNLKNQYLIEKTDNSKQENKNKINNFVEKTKQKLSKIFKPKEKKNQINDFVEKIKKASNNLNEYFKNSFSKYLKLQSQEEKFLQMNFQIKKRNLLQKEQNLNEKIEDTLQKIKDDSQFDLLHKYLKYSKEKKEIQKKLKNQYLIEQPNNSKQEISSIKDSNN